MGGGARGVEPRVDYVGYLARRGENFGGGPPGGLSQEPNAFEATTGPGGWVGFGSGSDEAATCDGDEWVDLGNGEDCDGYCGGEDDWASCEVCPATGVVACVGTP